MFNITIKKIFQFIITLIIGTGLFILILEKATLEKILEVIKMFPLWKGLIILLLLLFDMSILSWRWSLVLKSQGYKVSFKKLFIAKLVGFSVNYITPIIYTGGEPARAYVLKKETSIPFTKGFISIIIDEFLEFICGSLFLMIGIIFLLARFEIPYFLLSSLTIITCAALIFWIYFYKKFKTDETFLTSIINFLRLNKINFINNNKDKIIQLEKELMIFLKYKEPIFLDTILLTISSIGIGLVTFKLITLFLGFHFSLGNIIIIRVLSILAGIIPIPASLGTMEASDALAFIILGLSAHIGITFALIIRVFYLLLTGSGLFLLSHYGVKLADVFLTKGLNNDK